MQKCVHFQFRFIYPKRRISVNLVDLVRSFQTSIYLQNVASMQPRTGLSKLVKNEPEVRKEVRKNLGMASSPIPGDPGDPYLSMASSPIPTPRRGRLGPPGGLEISTNLCLRLEMCHKDITLIENVQMINSQQLRLKWIDRVKRLLLSDEAE